ncbi:ABC-three component system protein [Microbulbifer sp. Q7]|uniref:ABC-three component system protein n=1 Tax=Microbulbifer sp. Q7 TaxID=1785091 RepID=UPI00082E5A91|nr:ABC-three component system protein [Microbulbifer sp. Q7]
MNEYFSEKAKKHVVKVSQGSGVLIQPKTLEFSYVLTAKHVVNEEEFPELQDIEVTDRRGQRIRVLQRILDANSDDDIAILKVEFQAGLELGYFYEDLNIEMGVYIYGYPSNRSLGLGEVDEPSTYRLSLLDFRNNDVLEFRNDSIALHEDVSGYSGSGIFYFNNSIQKVQILGIQNRMAEAESNDGHIRGYSIRKFIALIDSQDLEKLKPPYLSSFSHSESSLFSDLALSMDTSLDIVKRHLKDLLSQHNINNSQIITPEEIIDRFKESLLSHQQLEEDLYQPQMWIWFLEFLSVYLSLNQPDRQQENWEAIFLTSIFQRFRVIYTHKQTNFRRLYREYIAFTDFSSMPTNAKVLIFANGDKPPSPILDERLKEIPRDISIGLDRHQIDTVRNNKKLPNPLIHWPKLNEDCLADKEHEIADINLVEQPDALDQLIECGYGGVLRDE